MPKCVQCSSPFEIFPDEIGFLEKMVFEFGNVKVGISMPEICPDCRSLVRTAHRNEMFFYQRKSDLSGKPIIALYPDESPYKVYSHEEWWSDEWDAMKYGRDFDFSRPFFDQFYELQKAVPRTALVQVNNQNSPYTTSTGYCKNCHLINSSDYCEDCYYGKLIQKCRDSIDCSYLYNSEKCYECFSAYNCYNCIHLSYSQNSSDCCFSENLNGCKNCFLCTNLTNKEYYFMNQPVSKKEYAKKTNYFLGSYTGFKEAGKILSKMRAERIHKYAQVINCEDSTGDFLKNCQNCLNCYDTNESQDCRNVYVGVKVRDCYDCSNVYIKPELCYQIMGSIEAFHSAFCVFVFYSQDVLYSENIYYSHHCFGCQGLRRKEYCIFNKQYTKEEYERLVPKMIEHMKKTGEWGYMLPVKYSAHSYNESVSNEYYPLSRQEALNMGYKWYDEAIQKKSEVNNSKIPDSIEDVEDDIVKQVLVCETTGKAYKIMPQELKFYREMRIPVPHMHPDQRHKNRMALRNARKIFSRNCAKCDIPIQTTYSPDRPEKVYCEACYLKEVY